MRENCVIVTPLLEQSIVEYVHCIGSCGVALESNNYRFTTWGSKKNMTKGIMESWLCFFFVVHVQ